MQQTPSQPLSSRVIQLSLVAGVSLFLVGLLQWSLPFPLSLLAMLLRFGLFCILGIALLWSIVYGIRQFPHLKVKALVPAAISAIVLIGLLNFPFLAVWLKLNFALFESAREDVVFLVESEQLKADANGAIALPPAYRLTSDGGIIEQEGKNILFYTFRGIDNFAGFVYAPTAKDPQVTAAQLGTKVIEVEPMKQNWFWMSAT